MSLDQRAGNVPDLVDRASVYQSKLQSLANESIVPPNLSMSKSPKMEVVSESQFQMLPHVSANEIT